MPDSAISRLRRIHQQTRAAREVWGIFLSEFLWQWFGTLTLRDQVSREAAWKTCHAFLHEIQDASASPLGWFVVEGRGRFLGRLHFHFLLAGIPDSIGPREYERAWFRLAGTAVIVEYDNRMGAAHYCAGHLGEADLDYHLSDNLSRFRIPTKLTGKERCAYDADPCNQDADGHVTSLELMTGPRTGNSTFCYRSGTGIQSVCPGGRIRSQGGHVGSKTASVALAREAATMDQQLRSQWGKVNTSLGTVRKGMLEFGRLCREMRAKELHRYVPNPDSRKGYVSFEEYVEALTGGEVTRGKLYLAIALPGLTEGPNALSPEDIAEMPQANAIELTRLPGEERTPEMVELAKRTSKRDFPAKVQQKLNEKLPPQQQKTPRVDFFCKLHPTVKNKLEATIERFTQLPVVRDGDRALTLKEKAIFAICNAAEQFASEDLAPTEAKTRGLASGTGAMGSTQVVLAR
jgi:hypothetical protein